MTTLTFSDSSSTYDSETMRAILLSRHAARDCLNATAHELETVTNVAQENDSESMRAILSARNVAQERVLGNAVVSAKDVAKENTAPMEDVVLKEIVTGDYSSDSSVTIEAEHAQDVISAKTMMEERPEKQSVKEAIWYTSRNTKKVVKVQTTGMLTNVLDIGVIQM